MFSTAMENAGASSAGTGAPVDPRRGDSRSGSMQRLRNLAHRRDIQASSSIVAAVAMNNADQRGPHDRVPLLREHHHQQHVTNSATSRGSQIGPEVQAEIRMRAELRQSPTRPFRVRAEEVVDLPHRDDHRDTRGEAGDDRRG